MSETDLQFLTDFEKSLPHHELICVEGGAYQMGGDDPEAYKDEKPLHQVKVSSFYMGKFPVTQALYKKVMDGNNPSSFKGENRPVEKVSWDDAQLFLKKLNSLSGNTYRLPTEAEWEFAARGGIYSEGFLYAGSDKLKEVGWYNKNSEGETKAVAQKLPNELGIFDLSGNVYEWCEDRDGGREYYEACANQGIVEDPQGPESGSYRVLRGGDWGGNARGCRVSFRDDDSPGARNFNIGFRLVVSSQSGG